MNNVSDHPFIQFLELLVKSGLISKDVLYIGGIKDERAIKPVV